MAARKTEPLRSGSLWNLAGLTVPVAVALVCIPSLLSLLGPARFGALTLAWTIVGHFSLLDFGLSRALTYAVATRLARAPSEEPSLIVSTGMKLIGLVGVLMSLVFLLVAPAFVVSASAGDAVLKAEMDQSIYLLALGIPTVVITSGYRGLLEAEQRFAALNLIRIPVGSLTVAGPLIAAYIAPTLTSAVAALVIARGIGLAATFAAARRGRVAGKADAGFAAGEARNLARYGIWTSVSAVLSPIMTYCDRFIIGAASLAAVSIYATVFDVMIKLLILPAAVASAMFPILCSLRLSDLEGMQRTYWRGVLYVCLTLGPAILLLSILADPLLTLWIGEDFASQAAPLVKVLAIGIAINGVAHAPYALIHAHDRPDLPARLHLVEAPLYLILLIILLQSFGLVGAAWAWVIRVTVDAIGLGLLSRLVTR